MVRSNLPSRNIFSTFAQGKFAFWIRTEMSRGLFPLTTRIESCDAVIRVSDAAGNVIETHELKGDFKEW
jgi:hypothetical protein